MYNGRMVNEHLTVGQLELQRDEVLVLRSGLKGGGFRWESGSVPTATDGAGRAGMCQRARNLLLGQIGAVKSRGTSRVGLLGTSDHQLLELEADLGRLMDDLRSGCVNNPDCH